MQFSFAAFSCSNLAALSCSNLAALCVQRVCRPSCRLFLMVGREKLCVTHMSKLVGTHAILQVYNIFLVWHKNEFNLKPGNIWNT